MKNNKMARWKTFFTRVISFLRSFVLLDSPPPAWLAGFALVIFGQFVMFLFIIKLTLTSLSPIREQALEQGWLMGPQILGNQCQNKIILDVRNGLNFGKISQKV